MKVSKIELSMTQEYSSSSNLTGKKPKIAAYVQAFTDTGTLIQLPLSEVGILNILTQAAKDMGAFCGSPGESVSKELSALWIRLNEGEASDVK